MQGALKTYLLIQHLEGSRTTLSGCLSFGGGICMRLRGFTYEREHCRHHDQQVRPPHPADGGEIHLLGRFRRCGSLTYGGSMKDRCRFSLCCRATAISIFFNSIHISRYSSKTWPVNSKER